MKYALITGPTGFPLIMDFRLSYHLVLAQYASTLGYIDFYKTRHLAGDFIMVDNGAAEFGKSIGMDDIVTAAEGIGADEIIVPDVLDDSEATIALAKETYWRIPMMKRAIVPQGHDWVSWFHCLTELVSLGCQTICIAKRYERLPGGRVRALQILADNHMLLNHHIHLLGFDQDPIAEVCSALSFYPDIRGVDSAAPIAYAQKGMEINTNVHESYEWNKSYSYELAVGNVNTILNACNPEY